MEKWDKIGRLSLEAASAAASVGFSAAKVGTKLGVRTHTSMVLRTGLNVFDSFL